MPFSSTAMAVMSVIGTGISAYGAYRQSQAAQAQARYQAAVARNNQIIAQQNAADVQDRGEAAEDEHRRRIHQTKGAAKAVQASQGFLVDDSVDSTNVQMVADLAEAGALDILRIRDNTEREKHRALVQGEQFAAEAGLFDLKASSGGGLMAAAGTLLGGAQSAYKIYKSG